MNTDLNTSATPPESPSGKGAVWVHDGVAYEWNEAQLKWVPLAMVPLFAMNNHDLLLRLLEHVEILARKVDGLSTRLYGKTF